MQRTIMYVDIGTPRTKIPWKTVSAATIMSSYMSLATVAAASNFAASDFVAVAAVAAAVAVAAGLVWYMVGFVDFFFLSSIIVSCNVYDA